MGGHEAIKRCLGGYVKNRNFLQRFAKRLRISVHLLYRWMRPHDDYTDTGAASDLDRLEDMIVESLSIPDIPREDSIAPIIYLEERFGRIGANLEEVKECNTNDLVKHLSVTIKEFSDLTLAVSKDLADNGQIDKLKAIKAEGHEAMRAIYTLMCKAERSAK